MNIKKCILLSITIVLILSTIGIAQENNATRVVAISKDIGIDNSSGKFIVLVNIATNKIGHLAYIEGYYFMNESGKLELDGKPIMYYNDTIKNNTLVLKIKRPLDKNGERYKYVKAVAYIDNESVLNSWFKYVNKSTLNASTENSTEDKKSPGFEVVPIISILSVVYILRRRLKYKDKKK